MLGPRRIFAADRTTMRSSTTPINASTSVPCTQDSTNVDQSQNDVMAKGLSLHIGINTVNRRYYRNAGYTRLQGCVNDALVMQDIAIQNGFTVLDVLLDNRATFALIECYMREAAEKLRDGGTFMLTYSGHGAQISRPGDDGTYNAGNRREAEYDEGLVLSDSIMKDDYLNTLLRLFSERTSIIFVCDSCHSCSIYEFISKNGPRTSTRLIQHHDRRGAPRLKNMEQRSVKEHLRKFHSTYNELDRRFMSERKNHLAAHVVVLSACGDDERALDGPVFGHFTAALLNVLTHWGETPGSPFSGSYQQFIATIAHYLDPVQTPCFTRLGLDSENRFFQGPPFTIYQEP